MDCGIFTLRFSWKVENKWSERINGQRYKLRLKPAHTHFYENENENRDWRLIQCNGAKNIMDPPILIAINILRLKKIILTKSCEMSFTSLRNYEIS